MASLSSLRAQVDALKKKVPAPMPPLTMGHRIVAPNPDAGGPPIDLGLSDRFTINIPVPGYPALEERWHPWTMETPPPPTREDAVQFFKLIGQTRNTKPIDISARSVHGFALWRNSPIGPAVARYGSTGLEIVQPLWPAP